MNLVPEPIGESNEKKVTVAQLRAGAATLTERLEELRPRVVWVASKAAAKFAKPVVESFGARAIFTNHPSRSKNITDEALRAAFAAAVLG